MTANVSITTAKRDEALRISVRALRFRPEGADPETADKKAKKKEKKDKKEKKEKKEDRKSTRLNSSHSQISYAVFCLKKRHRRLPGPAAPADAHGGSSAPEPGAAARARGASRPRRGAATTQRRARGHQPGCGGALCGAGREGRPPAPRRRDEDPVPLEHEPRIPHAAELHPGADAAAARALRQIGRASCRERV